ncbi:unnamed protein product [Dibothriocephalus latus]|uniref:Amidase domain-containing protein n=1 Tax=Dibothriocephalus latus TaxID=60516 RepID=A0A3P7LQN4_DIBLA|nr:unnamed protein product [Dibothriocephalus latus]
MFTWGPLCKDTAVCSLVMKSIINSPVQYREDATVPPLRYTEPKEGRKLRIGYFTDLECFVANPAVRRAILHTKEKLVKRGHEVSFRVTTVAVLIVNCSLFSYTKLPVCKLSAGHTNLSLIGHDTEIRTSPC